jgi:nudix-type nucleoside diphosphatase (YffH/AdpP family)
VQKEIRIKQVETLSDDWYVLKKTTFEYQRRDGSWQTVSRETYDRGNGATILLYNTLKKTVILTRQFRFPAFVNQHSGELIEACAGLLDQEDPVTSIQREAAEETGYRVQQPRKVFEAFMSPGSVTERLYFFVAEYQESQRLTEGGGLPSDGEDIEVLELPFADALRMIGSGEIADGKTIMLLQHVALAGLMN